MTPEEAVSHVETKICEQDEFNREMTKWIKAELPPWTGKDYCCRRYTFVLEKNAEIHMATRAQTGGRTESIKRLRQLHSHRLDQYAHRFA
jgi:hypothetical protein